MPSAGRRIRPLEAACPTAERRLSSYLEALNYICNILLNADCQQRQRLVSDEKRLRKKGKDHQY